MVTICKSSMCTFKLVPILEKSRRVFWKQALKEYRSSQPHLDKKPLGTVYYSCIHIYLSYEILLWSSANRTQLSKI